MTSEFVPLSMGSELGLQTQMAPMAKKEQEASKAFWV
jgi:hypothetical protein